MSFLIRQNSRVSSAFRVLWNAGDGRCRYSNLDKGSCGNGSIVIANRGCWRGRIASQDGRGPGVDPCCIVSAVSFSIDSASAMPEPDTTAV